MGGGGKKGKEKVRLCSGFTSYLLGQLGEVTYSAP